MTQSSQDPKHRVAAPAQIEILLDDETACVVCAGELDLHCAPRLRQAIDQALDRSTFCWIDLRGVDFVDSSGVHALVAAHRRAVDRGACLLIAPPTSRTAMRTFEMLGLAQLLPFAVGGPRSRSDEPPAGRLRLVGPPRGSAPGDRARSRADPEA